MTKLPMRWECAAPSWAWCCCARGMNCGTRWDKAARWLREEPREGRRYFFGKRGDAAPRRNDLFVIYRAATGPRAGAGGFRAHAGMRRMPHAATRPRTRIALTDARDAGGRGGAARQARPVSGADAQVDAMDLDGSVRAGRNRSLRLIYRVH